MKIKNLKKAANRIKKAIRGKERIILYGDADLDGTASVIIFKETVKNLAGDIKEVYFPHREKEGYGLGESALDYLKKLAPALLIIFDCGLSNFKEVELAKNMGFEVIIVDHHEVLEKLPRPAIVVNPKQKGDKYPFKFFATAGLVFKFAQTLLEKKMTDALKRNFLELVALATLADMMPEVDENKTMTEEGLIYLPETFRPGLRAFLELPEIKDLRNIREVAKEIISVLNIVEPKGHLNATYLILSASSQEEVLLLANELWAKRAEKRAKIRELTETLEERVLKKTEEPIIFEVDSSWPVALLGSAASRICSKFQKPTFIVSRQRKNEAESRGAVRTPEGVDAAALMKKCSEYLLSFGGHPPAAGFAIKNENLEKFKECLIKNLEVAEGI